MGLPDRGLVLIDRTVVPKCLRGKVLYCLHSAHYGVVGMKACISDSVYWSGKEASYTILELVA